MMAVAAFMMTMNFFACSDTSDAASAFGVSTNPAMMSTPSRTTSSCARRLATSGEGPPTSLRMISIFLPATVSPCFFMYCLIPLSICVAASANWPEYGRITPILTVPCASAAVAPSIETARLTSPITNLRIDVLPDVDVDGGGHPSGGHFPTRGSRAPGRLRGA